MPFHLTNHANCWPQTVFMAKFDVQVFDNIRPNILLLSDWKIEPKAKWSTFRPKWYTTHTQKDTEIPIIDSKNVVVIKVGMIKLVQLQYHRYQESQGYRRHNHGNVCVPHTFGWMWMQEKVAISIMTSLPQSNAWIHTKMNHTMHTCHIEFRKKNT